MFVGVHDRQLDDKGRLALPASLRAHLADRCYLTLDFEGCITVSEPSDFEQRAQELIEAERRGELTRSRRRSIATASWPASIDKQGRITLDENQRAHAGLAPGAPVKVVGTHDVIEIWRPSRFETVEREGKDEHPPRVWEDET